MKPLKGRVVDFDEAAGMGMVEAEPQAGGPPRRHPFHCTQIADGSRSVAVGAEVTFHLIAGRLGSWEAGGVTAL